MPRKSRHASHVLMLLGILFAVSLYAASLFVPKKKSVFPATPPENGSSNQDLSVSPTPRDVSIDTSGWKVYEDPAYRFSIKYPSDWPEPKTQKINDPDYEYEYEADFGTAETLDGNGFEGFGIFIFPTEKCPAGGDGNSSCATKKTRISSGAAPSDALVEVSTIAYTYTLIPYIPPDGADPDLVKKASLEFSEAQKSFSYDPNLKVLKPPAPKTASRPKPPIPPTPIAKNGKLTGAARAGGKLVCPHPNRKPQRSPNKGNHVDEDCCPDPDEWPNAACSYKPGDYKIMLKVK